MEQDKQKIDSDILKCKQDVLRAKQAVTEKASGPLGAPAESAQKPAAPTPLMAAVVEANKTKSQRRQGKVPQFNLAEQIMSQQRKATAAKRKAPTAKVISAESPTIPNKPHSSLISIAPGISNDAQIVAEIVTRDIRELCRNKSAIAS